LQALPKILEKYPDTVVCVAGNDLTASAGLKQKIKISGYGTYLRSLIKKSGLTDHVKFLGRLSADEMKEEYLKSNLYLCASALENSPNSLGEAMLLGVPSVASDTGGIRSVFEKDKDGLMFAPGNVEELTEKILYLFDNPDKMAGYAKCAKEHAKKTHNPDENYRRLLEIYQEIV
jgi:glycosyltransferase involved in cell wall biosynthesis